MSIPTECNLSNCLSCITNTSCSKCEEHYVIENEICSPCPKNCLNCDGINCLSCKDGYAFINDYCQRGQCLESNCAISGYKGCSKCEKGFTIFEGQCLAAPCSNFYPNCQNCDLTGCISCNWFYSLSDGTCSRTIPNWVLITAIILFFLWKKCLSKAKKILSFGRKDVGYEGEKLLFGKYLLYHENCGLNGTSSLQKPAESNDDVYVNNFAHEDKIEANLYKYDFQMKIFLEVLVLNLLYIFGVGIVLVPFCNYLLGWNFGRNTFKFQTQKITMLFGAASTVYLIHGILTNTVWKIDTQTLEYFEGLVFFCIASASIAAFVNPQVADLFSIERLDDLDVRNRHHWKFFSSEGTDFREEINSTFLRLNIDASLFYMAFLEYKTPDPHFLRHYAVHEVLESREYQELKQSMVIDHSLSFMVSRDPLYASELLNKIPSFERCLVELRYLSGKNRFDETHAFGYQTALYLAQKVQGGKRFKKIIFGLTLINYLICFVYDILSHTASENSTWENWVATIVWLVLNFLPRGLIALLIYETVVILASKLEHMKVLFEMISTERLPTTLEKDRGFPVIDIFDEMSLQTWNSLRKVLMHLNEQRLASLKLAIAILLVIQVSILAVITLFYFGILHLDGLNITNYLTFFGIDTTLFLIIIVIVFYYCNAVNKQFDIHRNLVRTNKGLVTTLFRSFPSIIRGEVLKPGSYILNCGYKIILEKIGIKYSALSTEKESQIILEKNEKLIEHKLQSLIRAYDQILQDLQFEDLNYPLKFYGVPVRKAFLSSIGVVIVTSLTPIIKKILANK